MMEINVSKKYSLIDLPSVLAIGFDELNLDNQLSIKLEQQLNLSYFIKKNREGKSLLLTEEILKVNHSMKASNLQKNYNDYLYELSSFVRKNWDGSQTLFFKIDNDWFKLENKVLEKCESQNVTKTNSGA